MLKRSHTAEFVLICGISLHICSLKANSLELAKTVLLQPEIVKRYAE